MKTLKTLSEDLKKRSGKAKNDPVEPLASASPAALPAWPEAVRGLPNCVLRSALFGMVKRGVRADIKRQILAVATGTEVIYSGERLDQGDLDVWSQCLHIARTHDLGLRVQFGAREFLRAIERSGGGHDIEWLKRSLTRLMECTVWIKDGKRMYSGHLLEFAGWDDTTERFVIEISPSAACLYGTDGWTAVELTQRQAVKGDLARWLHAFYATHTHPFNYKVKTLHSLCGSERGRLSSFRGDLRDACAAVAEATGWTLVIDDDDLLQVKKTGRRVRDRGCSAAG
jgi:hypothetical protein